MDDLVGAFTELGPTWVRWVNACLPSDAVSYVRMRLLVALEYAGEQSMGQLNRITQQPDVMGGKACIRGMRVTVGMVVGQIGAGRSVDDILADYPYIEREDVMQAVRYAAWRAEEREVELATA